MILQHIDYYRLFILKKQVGDFLRQYSALNLINYIFSEIELVQISEATGASLRSCVSATYPSRCPVLEVS